jgi:hypothetical protein
MAASSSNRQKPAGVLFGPGMQVLAGGHKGAVAEGSLHQMNRDRENDLCKNLTNFLMFLNSTFVINGLRPGDWPAEWAAGIRYLPGMRCWISTKYLKIRGQN